MKRRAHRSYLILTMAVVIGVGLHCDQVDEDPDPVLADLAGPGATACGFANGRVQTPTAGDVRACMVDALRDGRPFTASASPASLDGSITIGWASDGKRSWRVEYQLTDGCSPIAYDTLEQEPCKDIVDLGAACDSIADDLCFECSAP